LLIVKREDIPIIIFPLSVNMSSTIAPLVLESEVVVVVKPKLFHANRSNIIFTENESVKEAIDEKQFEVITSIGSAKHGQGHFMSMNAGFPYVDVKNVSHMKKKGFSFTLPVGVKLESDGFEGVARECYWQLADEGGAISYSRMFKKIMPGCETILEELPDDSQLDIYNKFIAELQPLMEIAVEKYRVEFSKTLPDYKITFVRNQKQVKLLLGAVQHGATEWGEIDIDRLSNIQSGHVLVNLKCVWAMVKTEMKEILVGATFELQKNVFAPIVHALPRKVTDKKRKAEDELSPL
jgi:hypothetical protein